VNSIYEKLLSIDVTKAKFGEHGKDINIDSKTILHRKEMLTIYFIKLFTADYDEEFITVCLSLSNFYISIRLAKCIAISRVNEVRLSSISI
jgi:hypothetical protein